MALREVMQPNSFLGPIEPLLDVTRAAHLLGISVKTLRDRIQGRRIDYVKVGTRVMIRPETIRQFVTANTRRAAGESFQTSRQFLLRLQVPVSRKGILPFDWNREPARSQIDRGGGAGPRPGQAAGLEEPEPQRKTNGQPEPEKTAPTLREFHVTFNDWVGTAKAEQQRTVKFYEESYQKLITFGPWADLPLDKIDESHIERFKTWALKLGGRRNNGKPTPSSAA